MKPIGYFLLVTTAASLAPNQMARPEKPTAAQQADAAIQLRCNLTYGLPFDVTIDLGQRMVQFHGGPHIPIVESNRVSGALRLRGNSGSYHLESAVGAKPHVTFWESGSTPQKADCTQQATRPSGSTS